MVFETLGLSSDVFSQGLAGGAFFLKVIVFGLAAMAIIFLVYNNMKNMKVIMIALAKIIS